MMMDDDDGRKPIDMTTRTPVIVLSAREDVM